MATSLLFVNADEDNTESQTEDGNQVQSEAQVALTKFWPTIMEEIQSIRNLDLKQQLLPLARIKKIMKLDEEVKMISAEAPLLFAKASEIFIRELTLRAWIHTEDNKRRTLQRNDIAMAITKYDQFDFLIDIVPREDIKPTRREDGNRSTNSDQVHYYFQLAQQHHANLQQNNSSPTTSTTTTATVAHPHSAIQIVQPQVQAVQVNTMEQNATSSSGTETAPTPVILQSSTQNLPQNSTGNVQIIQQVVSATGEIQQIPIQLTPQQLQIIKMQLQGNTSQPVIIQAPISTSNTGQSQIIQVAQQNGGTQQVFLAQSNTNTESE
ncbi:nuclear transcription factor Y subunit gamma-like [Rhynchophorus ferrugineus]|uniref:nuclear transcription factor Y subunit gamma-like n=1 Tax=Rhynchophorus ferrugineus TaxID=354439 RepID=UPI003FCDC9CF